MVFKGRGKPQKHTHEHTTPVWVICVHTCRHEKERTNTAKHSHRWSLLLTHSCHGWIDRFLTRVFNSNHINPPLGAVGMRTRQALSQPHRCLGSVLVNRGRQGEKSLELMGMNERLQSSLRKWHYLPLQRCLVVCIKSSYRKCRNASTSDCICCFSEYQNVKYSAKDLQGF